MASKDSKEPEKKEPIIDEVKGFDIKINEFGEVVCSHDMDKINVFLDENVVDKKLPNAPAAKQMKNHDAS